MKCCIDCGFSFVGTSWECPHCQKAPARIDRFLAFAPSEAEASEGFDPAYFEQLARLESKNFWFRSRNHLIVWALRQYFPGARQFLEIGCGTGFVLSGIAAEAPEIALHGSEIYSEGLIVAAERVKCAQLFQMDARRIPFADEFDVIGAFDVLEHIKQDETVLGQMHRAAKRGGGIIITVPQHAFLWSQQDEHARHVRRYGRRELIEKVERAGFEMQKTTSFVSLLMPLLIASRFAKRKPRCDFDPLAELRIGGRLNSSLERVLDLERTLLRAGITFPFGGSLLMIARKH